MRLKMMIGLCTLAATTLLVACGDGEGTTDGDGTTVDSTATEAGTGTPATADGFTTTATGLEYQITESLGGENLKAGDIVEVHYRGKLATGEVFDESYERGSPIVVKIGIGAVIPGWDEGLQLCAVGDKAVMNIPSALGYGAQGGGDVIPPNADLVFDVEVVNKIELPFNDEGLEKQTTASGLAYTKVRETEGPIAVPGDYVLMHYTGTFEDGSVFDSSFDKGQPLPFQVGTGGVIAGWDEAATLLRKGEMARLYVPASLAYGEEGYPGAIPPNSDLIFDVLVVEVVTQEQVQAQQHGAQ